MSTAVNDHVRLNSRNAQLDDTQLAGIGKGLLFDNPFSSTSGRTNTNVGFDRINQSLDIIFSTVLKEVPMLPILGSTLDSFLFETIDGILDEYLELAINDAITKLEPRIVLLATNISHEEKDNNKIIITLEYRLTKTNICNQFRKEIVTNNGGDVL